MDLFEVSLSFFLIAGSTFPVIFLVQTELDVAIWEFAFI